MLPLCTLSNSSALFHLLNVFQKGRKLECLVIDWRGKASIFVVYICVHDTCVLRNVRIFAFCHDG